jgi:hypothetical protein
MVKGAILSIFDMTYGYVPVHVLPKSLEEEIGPEDMKIITRESIGLGGVMVKTFTVNGVLYVSKSFSAPMPDVRGGETLYSLSAVGVDKEAESDWTARVSDASESLRALIALTEDASKPEVKEAIERWLTESAGFLTSEFKQLADEGKSLIAQFAGSAGIENLAKLFHLVLVRQPFLVDSSIAFDPRLITFLSPSRKTLYFKNPSTEDVQMLSDTLPIEQQNPEIPRTLAVYQFDGEAGSSAMSGEDEDTIELEKAVLETTKKPRALQTFSHLRSVQRGWIVILESPLSVLQDQKAILPVFDGTWHNLESNRSYEIETRIIEEAMKEDERRHALVISNEVLKINAWARKIISTICEWEMSRGDLKDQLSVDEKLFALVEEICRGEYGVDLSKFYAKRRRG